MFAPYVFLSTRGTRHLWVQLRRAKPFAPFETGQSLAGPPGPRPAPPTTSAGSCSATPCSGSSCPGPSTRRCDAPSTAARRSTSRWPMPSPWPSRTGRSSMAPRTTPTGSSRSPASPPRSTTPSSRPRAEGKAVTEFSGKELIKGEPDASSLPVRRHALHVRGARLHGMGPDQPAVDLQDRLGHDARHPERLRELDRRVARQEDAAAPLDRGAVQAGRPHPEAVRLDGRPRHDHLRPRAGVLPDRPRTSTTRART